MKTEEIPTVEAAKRYGIDVNNIYRWVSSGVARARGNLFEINTLKRENRELKKILEISCGFLPNFLAKIRARLVA